MKQVFDWMVSHPEFMAAIVWPLLTALVTAIFKPRSAEEYSALPPKVAAALKLLAALGLDAPKVIEAAKEIVAKKPAPALPPAPPEQDRQG